MTSSILPAARRPLPAARILPVRQEQLQERLGGTLPRAEHATTGGAR